MLIILSLSDSVWSCLVVCVCIDWLKLAGSHHTTDHSCCMVSFTLYTVCTTSTSTCSISVCTDGPDGQMARWEHSGWTVSVIISHWHSSVNLGTQLDWRTICRSDRSPHCHSDDGFYPHHFLVFVFDVTATTRTPVMEMKMNVFSHRCLSLSYSSDKCPGSLCTRV